MYCKNYEDGEGWSIDVPYDEVKELLYEFVADDFIDGDVKKAKKLIEDLDIVDIVEEYYGDDVRDYFIKQIDKRSKF